jgi:uncharacterized protein YbcV (DUF1398 family)
MREQNLATLRECTLAADENRMTFPQILGTLMKIGVEGYYCDLRRSTKTYYARDEESVELAAEPVDYPISSGFDAQAVEAAVRQSQAGTHTYQQFCKKVMAAGCAGYVVSILGRRVVYFGRTAETHVEYFPAAN